MYLLETHLHTIHNSSCGKVRPARIARVYHKAQYNGIICTNHVTLDTLDKHLRGKTAEARMDSYFRDYHSLQVFCGLYGIDVYLGMEINPIFCSYSRKEPPYGEILVYGCTEEDVRKYARELLFLDQKGIYEFCSARGWLTYQAHPYRKLATPLDMRYLDGIEVYNGHPHHDSHNDLALALAEANPDKLRIAGSDYHDLGAQGSGILLPERPTDYAELLEYLRSGNFTIVKRK